MNEEEYCKRLCFLVAAIVAMLVFIAYVNTGRGNVSYQQSGIEPVKQQLDTISNYQQSAAADIERAERYAQSGQVRLDGAAGRAEQLQAGADESAKLIADCQRIIRAVQERGATAQAKN